MTYNEWLEKELNIYKRENNLLNDKHENLTTMFNEVHDNELETRDKKNEILKWAYSLEKENAQLKKELDKQHNYYMSYAKRISQLKKENLELKNERKWWIKEYKNLKQENEQLKDEIINLKTEIVDHRIKAYRLTKILNETSDYT